MTEIAPSPFGAGTTYDGAGKYIVAPERHDTYTPPRIARTLGERAAEVVVNPPRISRPEVQVTHQTDTQELQVVPIHELQQPQNANSYAGSASRQMDLDRAEALNIQRAAVEAGMSVDQWKTARRQR